MTHERNFETAKEDRREAGKMRDKQRKESRTVKHFDGMRFDSFRGGQFAKAVR
jgi:hypothetical protein